MPKAYIGIGSNLGERELNIKKGLKLLDLHTQIEVLKVSSLIETEPVGGIVQGKFLNGVAKINTSLPPQELLLFLQAVEKELKRKRTVKNGPRTLDLDILLYGNLRLKSKDLEIPHPRMLERAFVLRPLLEIEPEIFDRVDFLRPYKERAKEIALS